MKREGAAAVDGAQGAPKKPKIDAAALRAKLQKTLSTVKKLQKGTRIILFRHSDQMQR